MTIIKSGTVAIEENKIHFIGFEFGADTDITIEPLEWAREQIEKRLEAARNGQHLAGLKGKQV